MWSGEDLYAMTVGHIVIDAAGDTFKIQHQLPGVRIRAKQSTYLRSDIVDQWTREAGNLKKADGVKEKIDASLPRIHLHNHCG
jgi:hypothetical protein